MAHSAIGLRPPETRKPTNELYDLSLYETAFKEKKYPNIEVGNKLKHIYDKEHLIKKLMLHYGLMFLMKLNKVHMHKVFTFYKTCDRGTLFLRHEI